MVLIRRAAIAVGALAVAACASPGATLEPAPTGLSPTPPAAAPSDTALVIYSHGSRAEFVADPCEPRGETTPPVAEWLAGQRLAGYRIAVYADCQPSRRGDFVAAQRSGEPKVEQRAADIEALVERFAAVGLPPERIILMGHSAGAWASLWAARNADPPVAGVVALAPAFAGLEEDRSAGWQWLRRRHMAALRESERLDALLFAFAGDAFEDPADLAALDGIAGVERVTVAGPMVGGCGTESPHRTALSPCFAERYGPRIGRFVAARLPPRTPSEPARENQ